MNYNAATVEMVCKNCFYWGEESTGLLPDPDDLSGDEAPINGECRRYAPKTLLIECPEMYREWTEDSEGVREEEMGHEDARRVFPVVWKDDFCGDWKPLPQFVGLVQIRKGQ